MSDNHDSTRMNFNKGWQQPVIVLAIIVFTVLIGLGFGLKHSGYAMSKPDCGEGHCMVDGKDCKDGDKKGCCKDGDMKDCKMKDGDMKSCPDMKKEEGEKH